MEEQKELAERLDRIEQKAGDYEESFGSCAQGTLAALQEELGLGNAQVLKAATAMPGMALRGETCGAVTAAIMALGLAFGREKPGDFEAELRTTKAARRLCRLFEQEFGGCNCRDVQHHIYGRSFNLLDPKDQVEFVNAGAQKKCRAPAGKAARIAGQMIIEGTKK